MLRKALVVGATGYIATELVKQLLEKGYFVTGTVRDLNSSSSQFLLKLAEAFPGTLQLVEGDILTPGVFDEAVKDVHYVFHTASPVMYFVGKDKDAYKDLIDVAVQGTANTMNSVAEHGKHVRRIVLTSGLTAVEAPMANESTRIFTAADWNDHSSVENGQAYPLSKVLQERKAMEIASERGLDLVSILPAMTAGPVLSPYEDSISLKLFQMALKLKTCKAYLNVDVRDVAKAHILAAEIPEAHGRYIVSFAGPTENESGVQSIKRLFPQIVELEELTGNFCTKIDTSTTEKELHFRPRDAVCYYADFVRTWLRFGL